MMQPFRFIALSFLVLILFQKRVGAQESSKDLIQHIEALLIKDNLPNAEQLVHSTLSNEHENLDLVSELVYWLGKIELQKEKGQFEKANTLADSLLSITKEAKPRYNALIGIARLHNELGNPKRAREKAHLALMEAEKMQNPNLLATSYYYLGEFGLRSGNLDDFEKNTRKAFDFIQGDSMEGFTMASRILNYMGAAMYLTSKPDSALTYYRMALDKVDMMEKTTENTLYFPAAIKANMVLLLQSQNQYTEALRMARECIVLNHKFLNGEKKHPLRFRAIRNLSLAYRNLASLYEQIGDYRNTHIIAQLAYDHAKAHIEPHLLEYFSAVTLLAEAKIAIKEYEKAIEVLKEAKKSLDKMDGENPLPRANYYTIAGRAYFEMEDYEKAREFYEKGNAFHDRAQEGSVSSDRFFSDMNLALCHAHLGEKEKAYALLDQHDKRLENESVNKENRLINAVHVNYAKVATLAGDFNKSLSKTEIFLKNNPIKENEAVNVFIPEILTLNAKARYELDKAKNVSFLKQIETSLQQALDLIDNRKSIFTFHENADDLVRQNLEVFAFAKRIYLELYEKTTDMAYLEKLLNIHESSIYNRIRSRLGVKDSISSFNVPMEVAVRERQLHRQLKQSTESMEEFLKFSLEWNGFLDSLKQNHSDYHKLRYAKITTNLKNLRTQIPEETTVVRYLFVDHRLFAYVVDGNSQELIPLQSENLKERIGQTSNYAVDLDTVAMALHDLYTKLWQPISNKIKNKNIIILPDRELFNLSFEILTPNRIRSFRGFPENSLLTRYNISYHYSLQLVGHEEKIFQYDRDFVAFVPEFDTQMKDQYTMAISDSLFLDKTYLTLLPQPFSSALVKEFSRKFDGNSFLNENASKQMFIRNAKEHKIIHIGTHAESDNQNPELSRLIFAKNVSDSTDINDNYLYTYEIYDQNLSSNLAILTACETGKPTYQPGEGMISLAHAFNYAGSESILTSLWQIDEKSSSKILEYFYDQISKGKSKSEALRLAKLEYLKVGEGRTLHPQYWAGLVLMGDTSALQLSEPGRWGLWLLPILLIVFLTIFLLQKKSPHKGD